MSFIEMKTPSEDHTEGKWKGRCEQIFLLVAASGLSTFPPPQGLQWRGFKYISGVKSGRSSGLAEVRHVG